MSINNLLNVYNRPTVIFDVKSEAHRRWAYDFIKNKSWKNCPVLFALPASEDNVYNMVVRILAEYYTNQEFSRQKTRKKVAKKPQKPAKNG